MATNKLEYLKPFKHPDMPVDHDFLKAVSKGLPTCERFSTQFAKFSVSDSSVYKHLVRNPIDPVLFKVVLGRQTAAHWMPTLKSALNELKTSIYAYDVAKLHRTWATQREWWRQYVRKVDGNGCFRVLDQPSKTETPNNVIRTTKWWKRSMYIFSFSGVAAKTHFAFSGVAPVEGRLALPRLAYCQMIRHHRTRADVVRYGTVDHRLKSYVVPPSVIKEVFQRAQSSSCSRSQIMEIAIRRGLGLYLRAQAQRLKRRKQASGFPLDTKQPKPRPVGAGRIVIRVPKELADRVRAASKSTRHSVSEIVAGALTHGLRISRS